MFCTLLAERVTKADPLRVIDFGGACGFHHRAASLIGVPLRWAVVETPAMVAKAKALASPSLDFFPTIEDAVAWAGGVDLVFSSSALQYLDDPDAYLRKLVGLGAPLMAWSRLPMTDGDQRSEMQQSRLGDNGPGPLPPGFEDRDVSYRKTYLAIDRFVGGHAGYALKLRSGDMASADFVFLRDDLAL